MKDLTLKASYYYDLPENLIAQSPAEPRDSSRLLYFNPNSGVMEHLHFSDVLKFFKPGDVMVVNSTKVIPARLLGTKKETGAKVEVFLLKRLDLTTWQALVKPGRRLKEGAEIEFSPKLSAKIIGRTEGGERIVEFYFDGVFEEILDEVGNTPLPPYIHTDSKRYKERYNTVYAKTEGSSAAPTAGLHFTPEILAKLKNMGVTVVEVLLDIGLGTFRPVKEDSILNHEMHTEHYVITEEVASVINKAKSEGRRIIAVGTTSVRSLESASENGVVKAGSRDTSIFIYPGSEKKFSVVDCLITNFHLPESTLIMLVSAFIGYDETMKVYKEAVTENYRFFSFGDACFFEKKEDKNV